MQSETAVLALVTEALRLTRMAETTREQVISALDAAIDEALARSAWPLEHKLRMLRKAAADEDRLSDSPSKVLRGMRRWIETFFAHRLPWQARGFRKRWLVSAMSQDDREMEDWPKTWADLLEKGRGTYILGHKGFQPQADEKPGA